MKTPNAIRTASPKRRREIIEAALACFTEKGFPATSIADICKKTGASTSSVYHHFKSKGRLAAAIYLEGIRDYQAGMIDALSGQNSTRQGIFAIVRYHLVWMQHPKLAFINYPMFESLRRWMGIEKVTEKIPLEFTIDAMTRPMSAKD